MTFSQHFVVNHELKKNKHHNFITDNSFFAETYRFFAKLKLFDIKMTTLFPNT